MQLDFFSGTKYVFYAVRKLPQVEEARELMMEAMDWSVFTWLFQKRRVREAADRANAALDKLSHSVKSSWTNEIKTAYKGAMSETTGKRAKLDTDLPTIDSGLRAFVQKVKEADEAAYRARMTAEDTFEVAERQLNTDLARKGCRQAIHSWELYEKAIRYAEAFPGPPKRATQKGTIHN